MLLIQPTRWLSCHGPHPIPPVSLIRVDCGLASPRPRCLGGDLSVVTTLDSATASNPAPRSKTPT